MRTLRTTLATTIAALLMLLAAPANADISGYMVHDEWTQVDEGMTKAHVNQDICNCSGQDVHYQMPWNGNTYWAWKYATKVGTAFVYYRWNGSEWRVGYKRYWCADWYQDVPAEDCTEVHKFY